MKKDESVLKIPKVIHFCWFGENELSSQEQKCIQSWQKNCPNYTIKKWDENNFDVNCCTYVKEAYQAKKWAFVSDYARFWILYNYGGIYFDTDVELIKPIDDILAKGPFMGLESGSNCIAPGLGIACYPKHPVYKEIVEKYSKMKFILDDGTFNDQTVVFYTTEILKKYGFKDGKDIQNVVGIHIYPADFFCPMNYENGVLSVTDNTRSIHHYRSSWFSDDEKQWLEKKRWVMKTFGVKAGKAIWIIPAFVRQVRLKGIYKAIRMATKRSQKKKIDGGHDV